ncbi:MAG: alpha/beta hydrolase [Phycisphaerae bacterium]|nr:alpha/beta hydrolase [Phycisphaerae bacterium]
MQTFLLQLFGVLILFAAAGLIVVTIYVSLIVQEVRNPPKGGLAFALARGLPSTPEDLGLPHRAFDVDIAVGAGRAVMPVWEVSRSAEAIDDTTCDQERLHIVLLHGWGRSRIDSLNRLGPFLFENASVYLPDLRGHGDSRIATTLGTLETEDIDRLLATLSPGPVILAGHSMGATIAIRCAVDGRERSRVKGVVAIAPYDTILTPIESRLAARDLPRGLFMALAKTILRWRGVRFHDTQQAATQLTVPLLVLQGEHDRISPRDPAKAIADAVPARDLVTYVELPDVEHADHHARHPERFEREIREFLRLVLSANPRSSITQQ